MLEIVPFSKGHPDEDSYKDLVCDRCNKKSKYMFVGLVPNETGTWDTQGHYCYRCVTVVFWEHHPKEKKK